MTVLEALQALAAAPKPNSKRFREAIAPALAVVLEVVDAALGTVPGPVGERLAASREAALHDVLHGAAFMLKNPLPIATEGDARQWIVACALTAELPTPRAGKRRATDPAPPSTRQAAEKLLDEIELRTSEALRSHAKKNFEWALEQMRGARPARPADIADDTADEPADAASEDEVDGVDQRLEGDDDDSPDDGRDVGDVNRDRKRLCDARAQLWRTLEIARAEDAGRAYKADVARWEGKQPPTKQAAHSREVYRLARQLFHGRYYTSTASARAGRKAPTLVEVAECHRKP